MAIVKNFCRDENGNFAILFAISATLLLIGAMVAIDINQMVSAKTKVAAITDAAALAGAQAFDQPNRIQVVQEYLTENSNEYLPSTMINNPIIRFDDNAQEVHVSIDAHAELPFAKIMGLKDRAVAYKSVAAYPDAMDPLTIAFALDISGSMGWSTADGQVKIDTLKSASAQLFQIIEQKVKNPSSIDKYIRTGVSAFNSGLAVDQDMEWGFETTKTTIQELTAGGTTNTFSALENAHKQILDDRMVRLTEDPGFNLSTLDEFVIFMTDGENTAGDPVFLDDESYETCIAMREDGIEVYAIAFTAPARGQMLLLDCASWDNEAEDAMSGRPHNRRKGCKILAGLTRVLPDVNRLQQAYERCKTRNGKDKKDHYYDAHDAKSFEQIFREIAEKINESSIRIKS